jgi:thiosulfate dehydrogenase [quinone] large subunit
MSSSAADAHEFSPTLRAVGAEQAPPSPVTLSERSLLTLALVRVCFGLLWFQQLGWKMPPDFGGLRADVEREVQHTILPGYNALIQHVFLTHFAVLGSAVWAAEFLVSISLLLGLFTRLGAALALLLSLQLYLGIAYAPGEWYWAYGMLLLLSCVVLVVPTGRRLGVDQVLWRRLRQAAPRRRLAQLLLWLV